MTNDSAPPTPGRDRAPLHWGADLVLALITGAGLTLVLALGLLYASATEFGLLEPIESSAHQWQGIPLTAEVFLFVGILCAVATLAALGFRSRRAPFGTAVHGLASVLLLGLMLIMASASYEATHPRETRPDPASTEPSRQCRSGGDNSECPGG
ncbi:DUF6234 family protein [Streptomyces sp. NBC_01351]|uniref:DUF6234 family protein n=1 Tax=Streptomyces sp. NBC_01351 TaxID=2903833 RepID=UPI002E37FB23|nr:DUF6234 family protein [Streptomyces sp. NBC_01351]